MADISVAARDWIRRRTDAVRQKYSAYSCMHENGHGEYLVDEDTPVQIFCAMHDNKNTMAARYYPAAGHRSDYVHCFRCKESWDCIKLVMKFKNLSFMEALKELERRFHIRIPQMPEGPAIEEPKDRTASDYVSDAWSDVPRVLKILEGRLSRVRDKVSMYDFVKFCRVLDAVHWDLEKGRGQQTVAMVEVLGKLRTAMERAETPEILP